MSTEKNWVPRPRGYALGHVHYWHIAVVCGCRCRLKLSIVRYGDKDEADHDAERNDSNAGAQPGKKGPLVCGMVTVAPDRRGTSS